MACTTCQSTTLALQVPRTWHGNAPKCVRPTLQGTCDERDKRRSDETRPRRQRTHPSISILATRPTRSDLFATRYDLHSEHANLSTRLAGLTDRYRQPRCAIAIFFFSFSLGQVEETRAGRRMNGALRFPRETPDEQELGTGLPRAQQQGIPPKHASKQRHNWPGPLPESESCRATWSATWNTREDRCSRLAHRHNSAPDRRNQESIYATWA